MYLQAGVYLVEAHGHPACLILEEVAKWTVYAVPPETLLQYLL